MTSITFHSRCSYYMLQWGWTTRSSSCSRRRPITITRWLDICTNGPPTRASGNYDGSFYIRWAAIPSQSRQSIPDFSFNFNERTPRVLRFPSFSSLLFLLRNYLRSSNRSEELHVEFFSPLFINEGFLISGFARSKRFQLCRNVLSSVLSDRN